MSNREMRLHCPVCLGSPMGKLQLSNLPGVPSKSRNALVLNYCIRCQGIWFDIGEVIAAQKHVHATDVLSQRGLLQSTSSQMHCHACHGLMDRDDSYCPTCDWQNQINCPICQQSMQLLQKDNLKLDQCSGCQGIWLDASEIRTLLQQPYQQEHALSKSKPTALNLATTNNFLTHVAEPTLQGEITRAGLEVGVNVAAEVGINTIQEASGLTQVGVTVVDSIVQGIPTIAEASAEAIISVVEVSGEAAGSIVEVIVQAIAGLL
jgi:Zn-finger nucleic acid-binding protein